MWVPTAGSGGLKVDAIAAAAVVVVIYGGDDVFEEGDFG